MTREEIVDLLEMLVAAYPNSKVVDPGRMVDAWYMAFSDRDAGEIYRSARHHMSTCKFFPTIADINESTKYAFVYEPVPAVANIESGTTEEVKLIESQPCSMNCPECPDYKSFPGCPWSWAYSPY